MKTLQQFAAGIEQVPAPVAWYLADLGEARGKQELLTRQTPQRLRVLREHALIESAVSSNRIEGVEVAQRRIKAVLFGKALLRDRDEEEVRGYRQALEFIHRQGARLPISEETFQRLHRLARGGKGDAGHYKEKDTDIIERYPEGRERVRFRPVPAAQTPAHLRGLVELWDEHRREPWVHPLLALAAFNLDFLCIHPFRDGNGRVSRLLLLLQCYHLGYEVGRYISLERLIEQHKERYYETLEASSQRWHEGRHDPWPYLQFLLYLLKVAYREFEERAGQTGEPRGAKTDLVVAAIHGLVDPFRVGEVQAACPGVSVDLIRKVLKALRKEKRVECLGRGQKAVWQKTRNWRRG
jgi:Fic family protein